MSVRALAAVALALAGLGAAPPAFAELRVAVLSRDARPMESTTDVRCHRFATETAEPKVWRGMPLLRFDELTCDKSDIQVDITDGAVSYRATGPFRIQFFLKDNELRPAIFLGLIDADGGDSTDAVGAGFGWFGPWGTTYTVKVYRDTAEQITTECLVYDGEVRWREESGPEETCLAGEQLRVTPDSASSRNLMPVGEIDSAASRFASLAVAKSIASGLDGDDARNARPVLTERYREVFARPGDARPLIDLAMAQVSLGLPDEALRQLERPAVAGVANEIQTGRIAAARSQAYRIQGDHARADEIQREYGARFPGLNLPRTQDDPSAIPVPRSRSMLLPSGGQPSAKEALRLGQGPRLRSLLEEKLDAGTATSADLFDLAILDDKAGNKDGAALNAARALELGSTGLTPDQQRRAGELIRAANPDALRRMRSGRALDPR
jgi:hypothetical protein